MIVNPDQWPMWPRLPIKRLKTGGGINATKYEIAFVFAGPNEDGKWHIFFANAWGELPAGVREDLYDSAEAIVEDGWRVD